MPWRTRLKFKLLLKLMWGNLELSMRKRMLFNQNQCNRVYLVMKPNKITLCAKYKVNKESQATDLVSGTGHETLSGINYSLSLLFLLTFLLTLTKRSVGQGSLLAVFLYRVDMVFH